MVKKANLEKFLKKGGYEIVEFKGNTWRGIAETHRITGLAEASIRRILKEHPTPPAEIQGRRIWMSPEKEKKLEETISTIDSVSKKLETVREYFDRSLIIDLVELQARKELQGWTDEKFRESLIKQVEADKKEKGSMEQLFVDTLIEFHCALNSIKQIDAELKHA